MIYPDKKVYLKDAASYTVIPVFKELRAEFETPLSVYIKSGGMFLLESIERGENVGRYSIIACGQKAVMTLRGRRIEIRENGKVVVDGESADIWEDIRKYFSKLKAPAYDGLPPFFGGAIGYLGYETVQYFEKIPVFDDSREVPDGILVVPETVLIYDSVKRCLVIVVATMPGGNPEEEYRRAVEIIESMAARLAQPLPPLEKLQVSSGVEFTALTPKSVYLEGVEKCKSYIRQGEIIQAVLSQNFRAEISVSPFTIYQSLRMINPSPYLFFLDFGEFSLIGSSPEVMVKVQNRELMTKPIAGTRKRGATLTEDARLARELLADSKEKAEHIMLVDLARNDLGRVAKPGSVEVVDYMNVEKFSHVMHIVSTIKAELEDGRDVFDIIRATFPAGTLSGAPKIRAMEIISEIEHCHRGPYGGMVFYMGFNGNLDSCITIRTILTQGGSAFIRAGAGIVADSVPENEYQESINKAQALFKAIEDASQGGRYGSTD
jgi:anthranilate synthase component 1